MGLELKGLSPVAVIIALLLGGELLGLLGSSGSSTDYNSGTLSVTPGTTLFAQPGLKITSTGGRATARVIVVKK